jgi:VWFA-related protein
MTKTLAVFLCLPYITAEAQQAPVFQSETRVVLIDAIVTGKKGEYVRDLTAKDFRVWEDNKEQTIKSFALETDSTLTEPRRLVLFFDDSGMSVADQGRALQAAASFVDANTGPNRLIAVVTFDGGFRVAQTFTGNAGRLKEVMRGVSFTASSDSEPGVIGGVRGRPVAGPDATNARGLIQSVENLARNLNAVQGRKVVVLFTGPASLAAAPPADVASLIQICNRSNVAVYPVVPGAAAQDASGAAFDLGQHQQPLTRNARLGAAPGIGNGPVPGGQADENLPFTIANGTGGLVLSGSNDLRGQLLKIGAEQSQWYVLGYTPPDSKEGVCHTLRVKVDRSGSAVRSRSSYCTAKPQDLLAENRVEKDLEKRAAGQADGAAASIQAPFFYAAPNVARVNVAMEIATDALKFENQKGRLHAEMNILGIASASDGSVAARFSDIVKRDFATEQDLDKWKRKPLHYEKEFKIVAGQYSLTVVFSSGGASFGKVQAPLMVPAYERSQFAISGLALSNEVRPASELGLEASLIDEGTPLIAGGTQLIPTGSNAFTKSEQAFCYFEVYTPGAADPTTIRLRILEANTGAPKWDGGAATLDPPAGGKFAIPVGLSVPVGALPPGSYQLEVTATGGANNIVRRTVDFEIK